MCSSPTLSECQIVSAFAINLPHNIDLSIRYIHQSARVYNHKFCLEIKLRFWSRKRTRRESSRGTIAPSIRPERRCLRCTFCFSSDCCCVSISHRYSSNAINWVECCGIVRVITDIDISSSIGCKIIRSIIPRTQICSVA